MARQRSQEWNFANGFRGRAALQVQSATFQELLSVASSFQVYQKTSAGNERIFGYLGQLSAYIRNTEFNSASWWDSWNWLRKRGAVEFGWPMYPKSKNVFANPLDENTPTMACCLV